MLMIYFSGTGNSRYIAELFCRHMDDSGIEGGCAHCVCHSVEEKCDFHKLIAEEQTIAFCFPNHNSRPPRIMRTFAANHKESLKGKQVIIFCTQWLFSGDCARAFTDLFPEKHMEIIYAEHFLMPNNISNLFLLPIESERKISQYIDRANQKMKIVCDNIKLGVVNKRGFNTLSQMLGLIQGGFVPVFESIAKKSLTIHKSCNQCKLCVSICPMRNLTYENGIIIKRNNCIACYRCINKCPQKALSVVFPAKVKKQYQGCVK